MRLGEYGISDYPWTEVFGSAGNVTRQPQPTHIKCRIAGILLRKSMHSIPLTSLLSRGTLFPTAVR